MVNESSLQTGRWAQFFNSLLAQDISIDSFEEVVSQHWSRGEIKLRAPEAVEQCLQWLKVQEGVDGQYGVDQPHLKFRSRWMVGEKGKPGAIYIQAPEEQVEKPRKLSQLNRTLHEHDSGRMALITAGSAVFHIHSMNENKLIDIPAEAGDLLMWPAWTPHTFDACEGFSLISVMADYVSPSEDGFTYPVQNPELLQEEVLV